MKEFPLVQTMRIMPENVPVTFDRIKQMLYSKQKIMDERQKRIEKLKSDMLKAIRGGQMVKATNLQQQIKSLMIEKVSLQKAAIDSLTVEEHVKAVNLMNVVFMYADRMESAALDLEDHMKKTGVINIGICEDAKTIKKIAQKYVKLIDSFGDEAFSESFAEMCDSVDFAVKNAVFKCEAQLRPIIEKHHEKNKTILERDKSEMA